VALNLGELVAGLRADEADFVRGLNEAELAMRGLTRDVNGQLRDLNGRFVTESEAMGQSMAYRIGAGARQAAAAVAKVGPAVAAVGAGVPAVAAVTTAFAGLAAGAVSAGLAVKAFQTAANPQLRAVAEVATLAEEAQKAAASGAEDATDKQKAYKDALAQLPPATQETARAFVGLKKDYKGWSDEMSGTTMPVFTKGIGILRDLLPSLTPFVRAAASAISGFLDEVAVGVKSAGFKQWAADMAQAAGPALSNFLTVIRNFAVGFGGLMQAFLPASDNMTGGLVRMSQAFADWATSLKGSEGFAQFIALAREGGTTLGQLAIAAGNLLVALGPLIGVTTQVALALARVVNALPPEVLSVLATSILTAVVAFKAFGAASSAVDTATDLMNSRLGQMAGQWVRTAAASVAAQARIAAAATLNAARTAAAWAASAARATATWLVSIIRTAAVTVAQFAVMAARAVAWAAVMAAQWLIAMGPVGWIIAAVIALVALVIAYWDEIKAFTVAAWNAIWTWVKGAAQKIWDLFLSWTIVGLIIKHWDTIKAKTVAAWNAILAWVKRIPGMIFNAFLNWTPLGLLIKHWNSMKTATVNKATELINWVKGIPGRVKTALGNLGSVLLGAGKALIQGFINGIKNMLGNVRSVASSVVSAARDFFPFSPAKRGPFSGHGYTTYSGRALMAGFVSGIEAGIPAVDRTLASLASVPTAGQMALSAAGAAGGLGGLGRGGVAQAQPVPVDLGGPLGDAIIEIIRDRVGIGGGDVQLYLGKRR
jgi:hypothetical protein